MKRVTMIATAVLVAIFAVVSAQVSAQETNTREVSYLTFSNTVELPGVTLPAGTYTFRLADTPQRNVVQVLDKDQKDIKGQWLFVQAERPAVTGDTVIMFKENKEGATPAVQYWYFPGEKIGKEFIYPKDQAQKIAERTGQKVRTEEGYVNPESASNAPAPQGQVAENAPAAAQPSAPAGSLTENRGTEVNQSANDNNTPAVGTTGSASASNSQAVGTSGNQARAQELPKTASGLPFSILIGLLALAGAFGTRAFVMARR